MTQDFAMANDAELLRRYADERSEAAFAEVVRRNLNLVHSAAIRQVSGNPAAAADIAQAVFTELACQAKQLNQHRALVGWLYTTTRRMAARYVRDETRRQRREWDAHVHYDLQQDPTNPEADWSRIAPVLDEAMHELVEADRNALLLRHFQQRPYAEVGAQLGLSENAARMRVERALDRLRQHLSRRGITSTASAVVIALNGPAVAAAPAGLTANVTAGALAAGALTASTFGLLSLMSSTLVKGGAVVVGCALLSTGLLLQQQRLERFRVEQASLKEQLAEQSAALGDSRELLARKDAELAASGESLDELLRLRGEVSVLRHTARQASRTTTTSPSDRPPPSGLGAISGVRTFTASLRSNLVKDETLVTGGWSTQPGKRTMVLVTPKIKNPGGQPLIVTIESKLFEAAIEEFSVLGLDAYKSDANETSTGGILNSEEFRNLIKAVNQTRSDVVSAPMVTVHDGQQATVEMIQPHTTASGDTVNIGPSIHVVPRVSPNGKSVDLTVLAQINVMETTAAVDPVPNPTKPSSPKAPPPPPN